MKIKEIDALTYLLQDEVGGRLLQLPLLVDDGRAILLDTGCAKHVEELILPALRELDLQPSALALVLNTHCDFDHIGGNCRLKQMAPQSVLCCGDADREQIESPEVLYRTRYDAYRTQDICYDEHVRESIMANLGQPQRVDLTLRGGERLRLGPSTELEVVSLPGHSHGHLGLFNRRKKTLFGGDAIHGAVYLDLLGKPALCPTYLYPEHYLNTIDLIDRLDLDLYVGCHWPVKHGDEVSSFCQESRAFVRRTEAALLSALAEPKALRELCHEIGPHLGSWPPEVNNDLCYAFQGHLDELVAKGIVQKNEGERPVHYRRLK